VEVPLPWERLLWSGRPSFHPVRAYVRGVRYFVTDFRLVRVWRGGSDELALHDIGDINRTQSRFDRLAGTSTIEVQPRDRRQPATLLVGVRRGAQLAALIELLAGDPRAIVGPEAVHAALAWEPRSPAGAREANAGIAAVLVAALAVVIGFHREPIAITYEPDDPIYPSGQKRDRDAIVQFMDADVMPWARATFGPLKGGPDRVTCATCHGRDAELRSWRMPAVAALPKPEVREGGWEIYSAGMDAQMRNAIYGYLAEPDKQAKAAYMRETVMPGMSRLLHRPAYDFTRSYAYNRSRLAFGCYHCHRVK
jgi:hypothetical protein